MPKRLRNLSESTRRLSDWDIQQQAWLHRSYHHCSVSDFRMLLHDSEDYFP